MTLVQLRHLIALAKSGSFSKSAQAVFLTQPALSRSIRALEDELGQSLFDRIGRRTEPTPFGRQMAARAEQLVFDADELCGSGRRMSEGLAGSLRIGMGSGPGAMLMIPLLLQMATRHPKVHVEVSRAGTELLVQSLRERQLDALVVDVRAMKPAADLRSEELSEMRTAFMCRRGHPLTRRRAAISFEQLSEHPIACTPLSDEIARMLVERYGPLAHPSEFVTLRCGEIASLVEVARRSDAVLLGIRAAAPDLLELRVAPALDATARFGMVTLARRTEAPALSLVRALMHDLMRD